jgi:hypothetical protein
MTLQRLRYLAAVYDHGLDITAARVNSTHRDRRSAGNSSCWKKITHNRAAEGYLKW